MKIKSALFRTTLLTGSLIIMPLAQSYGAAAPVYTPTGHAVADYTTDKKGVSTLHVGTGTIATVSTSGAVTTVMQTSDRADIFWKEFSSAVGDTIKFIQPNSNSIAINRVTTPTPSILAGLLQANGNVVIMNPYGVTFTKDSQTNLNGLLVTTAKDITEKNIKDMGKTARSISFTGATGKIENDGKITVNNGGFVLFAAPDVENTGTIKADQGVVILGATEGANLELVSVDDPSIIYKPNNFDLVATGKIKQSIIKNSGTLQAKSGGVYLNAQSATDINASVINLDGVTDVSSFGTGLAAGVVEVGQHVESGKVKMASNVNINVTGTIHADDANNQNPAGTVAIGSTGVVKLGSTSEISSNSLGDANSITVTGGSVESDGILTADGVTEGSGGTITLHALTKDVIIGQNSRLTAVGVADGYGGVVNVFADKGGIDDSGSMITNTGNSNGKFANSSDAFGSYNNINLIASKDIKLEIPAILTSKGDLQGNKVNIQSKTGNIIDSATINVDTASSNGHGGAVIMTASKNITLTKGDNTQSSISANGTGAQAGGVINLISKAGAVDDSGVIIANAGETSTTTDGQFENIYISAAKNVTLEASSELISKGVDEGGSIRVESKTAGVTQAGIIFADAVKDGNGGTIKTKAKGKITIADGAQYSARGGDDAGDGGSITFEAGNATGLQAEVTATSKDVGSPHGNTGSVNVIKYSTKD